MAVNVFIEGKIIQCDSQTFIRANSLDTPIIKQETMILDPSGLISKPEYYIFSIFIIDCQPLTFDPRTQFQ